MQLNKIIIILIIVIVIIIKVIIIIKIIKIIITIIIIIIGLRNNGINNNNYKHFFNLQVANSPSRLRFEANLSRESSECTEHSQDQTSQINTGKTVYVGNA